VIITITADGSASYYLGSEVRLSGTNTDTGTVYLFITGPNLDSVGDMLSNVTKKCVTGTPTTFVDVDVDSDDLWDYNWDTSDIELDTGSYTIYAVSSDKIKMILKMENMIHNQCYLESHLLPHLQNTLQLRKETNFILKELLRENHQQALQFGCLVRIIMNVIQKL